MRRDGMSSVDSKKVSWENASRVRTPAGAASARWRARVPAVGRRMSLASIASPIVVAWTVSALRWMPGNEMREAVGDGDDRLFEVGRRSYRWRARGRARAPAMLRPEVARRACHSVPGSLLPGSRARAERRTTRWTHGRCAGPLGFTLSNRRSRSRAARARISMGRGYDSDSSSWRRATWNCKKMFSPSASLRHNAVTPATRGTRFRAVAACARFARRVISRAAGDDDMGDPPAAKCPQLRCRGVTSQSRPGASPDIPSRPVGLLRSPSSRDCNSEGLTTARTRAPRRVAAR